MDGFASRFEKHFPCPKDRYGLLGLAGVIDICRELGLCRDAQSVRCFDTVRGMMGKKLTRGVFLFTDRAFDHTHCPHFHCSVILGYSDSGWHFDTPLQSGAVQRIAGVSDQYLEERLSHFLVLT